MQTRGKGKKKDRDFFSFSLVMWRSGLPASENEVVMEEKGALQRGIVQLLSVLSKVEIRNRPPKKSDPFSEIKSGSFVVRIVLSP